MRIGIEQSSPEGKSVDSIASQLLSEAIRSAVERPAANRAQIEIWLRAGRNDQEFACVCPARRDPATAARD